MLYQLIFLLFAMISAAASIFAIWCVAISKIQYRAGWIMASLFGFVGVGLNWNNPDDLFFVFGVQFPPITATGVPTAQSVFVKAMFPIGAIAALIKSNVGEAGHEPNL